MNPADDSDQVQPLNDISPYQGTDVVNTLDQQSSNRSEVNNLVSSNYNQAYAQHKPNDFSQSESTATTSPVFVPTEPQQNRDGYQDSLGVISIVLAFFVFPPVGIILGIIGLNKAKAHNHKSTLSIVGIVLGSIFTLISATLGALIVSLWFSGIQKATYDTERKTDISSLHAQLESYATSSNGYYPTLEQLNSSQWRSTNLISLSNEALIDPSSQEARLASQPGKGLYSYQGLSCDDKGCKSYILTATLEWSEGGKYTKRSLYSRLQQ